MKIGILETGITPEELRDQYGTYSQMFVDLFGQVDTTLEFEIYSVMNNEFPATITECDGWLITGSRSGVYEETSWMLKLESLVRNIKAASIPLVGICFGHQIIAKALGGVVEKSDKGWGVGLHSYDLTSELPYINGRRKMTVNAMHQDQVIEKPKGAVAFASSDFCLYAGLIYGKDILTFQAHPEFMVDFEYDLVKARRISVVPEEAADPALEELAKEGARTDSLEIAQWMSAFFKEKRA